VAAPWLYFLLMSVLGTLFFPRTLLLLISGLAFGVVLGSVIAIATAMVSAAVSFVIARYVASEWVVKWLARSPKVQRFGENIEKAGLSFILFARFLHLPFSPMNFALSLLPVSFKDYFIGSFIGLLPGSIVVVFMGDRLGCMVLDGKAQIPPQMSLTLGIAMTCLALLSLIPLLISRRKAKRIRDNADLPRPN
jgi:uncharacterized membrane protein YdjX (TVP38/TMEM64 family)